MTEINIHAHIPTHEKKSVKKKTNIKTELLLECRLKFFFHMCKTYTCIYILIVVGHGMNKIVSSLSLFLSRPAEGSLWSSVVRIVCFVMHNELVLHEIEAVGPGLERMANHVFHWGKTKTREKWLIMVW